MIFQSSPLKFSITAALSVLLLTGCGGGNSGDNGGLKVKLLVGSALEDFCNQAATKFNATKPKLENGQGFQVLCEALGSGDVVTRLVSQASQFKQGTLPADAPDFPTVVSVDGEIYQSQLIYQISQLFPGQKYIPEIIESPLIASTPMVFMAQQDIAQGLRKVPDLHKTLVKVTNHRDIDPDAPLLTVNYVHTAPTRSNSGLQTLVAQFVSVSGKRPEDLTVNDVQRFQGQVQQIQNKITRYGISTDSLAKAMAKNGAFWASVASVYESSVIAANANLQLGEQGYEAIYPQRTFSSNMRAIVPNAPWVSGDEKAAAEKFIAYLRSPETQNIATNLGLRPGIPGIPLGSKFSRQFGVDPQAQYDSLRPPKPEVVAAMLKSWQEYAKKPSQVVVVVDSSGSMTGTKLANVQKTISNYINSLGPKEKIALIDFDSEIRPPVLVDGTSTGRDRGLQFVSGLRADGATALYDAIITAQKWLQQNLRPNAINAVVVLTDGEDAGSKVSLFQLEKELQKTGFNTDQRISFFTVGYGNEGEFNPYALQKIAELNGGYYSQSDPDNIAKLMANLQVEF